MAVRRARRADRRREPGRILAPRPDRRRAGDRAPRRPRGCRSRSAAGCSRSARSKRSSGVRSPAAARIRSRSPSWRRLASFAHWRRSSAGASSAPGYCASSSRSTVVACIAFFLVSSAVGENIARLRYVAIPLAVLVLSLREWRPRLPALVVFALAISWNVAPLAASYVKSEDDPAATGRLLAAGDLVPPRAPDPLLPRGGRRHRPATGRRSTFREAAIPLARGWFRQDDFPQNKLLYGKLGPQAYLQWLRGLGVRYVVLTKAKPDYSARAEAALVGSSRSPLREVYRGAPARRLRGAEAEIDRYRAGAGARADDDRVARRRPRRRARDVPDRGAVLAVLGAFPRVRGPGPRRDDQALGAPRRASPARLLARSGSRTRSADGPRGALLRGLSRLAPVRRRALILVVFGLVLAGCSGGKTVSPAPKTVEGHDPDDARGEGRPGRRASRCSRPPAARAATR